MSELTDQTIVDIREMTDDEYELLYWTPDNMNPATVLELDDDTRVFAASDMEGNTSGFLEGSLQDQDDLIGATIEDITPMSEATINQYGWEVNAHRPAPPVLALSNGRTLYPLQDPEGNGPGALYHIDPDDGEVYVTAFETKN